MPTHEQLRRYPLFADLSERELTSLASNIVRRSFAKGTHIYHPGSPGLNLYVVEAGWVRLFYANHRGEEFLMDLITPPDCFGLPLLPDHQTRVTGAIALRDTVLLSLSRDIMFDAMRRFPQLGLNVYLEMSNAMRLLGEYANMIATVSVPGRLAWMLLHFSSKYPDDKKDEIDLPITQADVASMIGSSRGRVNRALAQFEEQGLIRVGEHKILILSLAGLVKISEV